MPLYYPIALNLVGRTCVVAGGGPVAERKVRNLLDAQARVLAVSPRVTSTIKAWADEGRIDLLQRTVQPGDLEGARLVIAATDDSALNADIVNWAQAWGAWANAVDDPACSDFIAPAVVQRGDLSIAISTGGASPALAAELRRRVEEQFGEEYAELVQLLGAFRESFHAVMPERARRELFWKSLLARDLAYLLDFIRRGENKSARKLIEDRIARLADDSHELTEASSLVDLEMVKA